jgi:hypothetical protein
MRCVACDRKLKQDDAIVPVLRWIESEKRSDFPTSQPHAFIHASHLIATVKETGS